jgi:thiol-disulfide isomerase/thioredoxin
MPHTALRILISAVMAIGTLHAAVTLEHPHFGSAVDGPTLTSAGLRGRVVLLDYWGIHCGPCLAAIPHLAALQEGLGRDNFIIIANQCQESDDATARAAWLSHGGGEQISVINQGSFAGAQVSTIPHCFLFDHNGLVIFDGLPSELGTRVEDAVKASPGALVVGHTYAKTARYAARIGAQASNLATTLKALRALKAGTEAVAQEESTFLLDRVQGFANEQSAALASAHDHDALAAAAGLAHMLLLLEGDPLAQPFDALKTAWKTDTAFQGELTAETMLVDLQQRAARLGVGRDGGSPPPKAAVAELSDGLHAVISRYPGSPAAGKALQLAAQWKL